MGFLRTAMRTGIATKLFNEARKPHNQAKAKELFAKLTGKGDTTPAEKPRRSYRRR